MKIPHNYAPDHLNNSGIVPPSASKSREVSSTPEISKEEGAKRPSSEKVELSSRAKDLQKVSEILKKTPDVREEKVSELKAKVANGTYQVKSKDVADKMVNEHLGNLLFNS